MNETKPGSNTYSGLTDNYVRVFVHSEKPLTNEIALVELLKYTNQGMQGALPGRLAFINTQCKIRTQ